MWSRLVSAYDGESRAFICTVDTVPYMEFQHAVDSFADRDWQESTDGTVRLALVGLGWWTVDEAIPAIRETDLCEVSVLVSRSEEKAQRFADEAGVPHAISGDSYHDSACADEYDAVYVCTPNAYHLEYVETAADLGKAVLCEKPMEASVERAERMAAVADDAGIPLMVAYRMHTEPAVRRARELVDAGVIGEPVQVYGNNSQSLLSIIDDPDQWRLDPDASGYGTSMMDLGIYPINDTVHSRLGPGLRAGADGVHARRVRGRARRALDGHGRLRRRRARGVHRDAERLHGHRADDYGD